MTCSIRVASIGAVRISLGRWTVTGRASALRRSFITALSTISSTTSSLRRSSTRSPVTRVTESIFSVMRVSQRVSCRICSSRLRRSSSERFGCSSSRLSAPSMEASGVRRSCERARSRSARSFSLSISYFSRSACLTRVVRVLMTMETTSITKKVSG